MYLSLSLLNGNKPRFQKFILHGGVWKRSSFLFHVKDLAKWLHCCIHATYKATHCVALNVIVTTLPHKGQLPNDSAWLSSLNYAHGKGLWKPCHYWALLKREGSFHLVVFRRWLAFRALNCAMWCSTGSSSALVIDGRMIFPWTLDAAQFRAPVARVKAGERKWWGERQEVGWAQGGPALYPSDIQRKSDNQPEMSSQKPWL